MSDTAAGEIGEIAEISRRGRHVGGVLLLLAAGTAAMPFFVILPRDADWLHFSLAAALTVAGALAWRGAPVAALLAFAVFVGGASQLGLTEPDWFSEFRPNLHAARDLEMVAALVLEAVIACAALWRARAGWSAPRIDGVKILLLLALTALVTTSLMRYIGLHQPAGFAVRVAILGLISAVHIAAVAALALAPDLPRVWPDEAAAAQWSRRAPWLLAGVVVVAASALALLAFRRMALVEDEAAYLFQAKTLAAGVLHAPALPAGAAQALRYYLIPSGASGWYAVTAPGWPMLLALGVRAGAPWLVNPLLGGLAVLLSHRLVARWSDRTTANLTALLMATSPWLLETSASMMTHALSLALIAGAWLLLTIAGDRQQQERRWQAAAPALLAGLLMGWLFVSRALEGVMIGGLSGWWLIWRVRQAGWRAILAYGAGCAATGGLVFVYNAAMTGQPLVDPLAAYLTALWGRGGNAFGFGPSVGPPRGWGDFDLWPGHSPLEGAINTQMGLRTLSTELLGWPTGSLLLVWIWLLWDRRPRFAQIMAALAALVIAVHLFYWFNAVFYIGPRYWYAAFLPLIIVSAFGARGLVGAMERAGIGDAGPRVYATAAILGCFAVTVFLPWRGIDKFAVRSSSGAAVAALMSRPDLAGTVLFVDAKSFQSAAALNDPWLRPGHPILARDLGAEADARTLAAFPGRRGIVVTAFVPGVTRRPSR